MMKRPFSSAFRALLGLALVSGLSILSPSLGSAADTPAKKKLFIPKKPTEESQSQKTVDDRGGVNPCNTKEPSPGVYGTWNRGPSIGQMIMPVRGGVTKDGSFDLVIHFHGHDPVRREFVKVMDGAVLVGIDLGIGSGAYQQQFQSAKVFQDLVASVEQEVAEQRGLKSAKARKIALSAWSAGYGAVEQILRSKDGKAVDAVILLDGLHAGYAPDGSLEKGGLEPFVEFAKRAKAGKRFMYVSHSSIIPPGYASTTETVNQLIHDVGGKPKKGKPRKADPMGLELNSSFDAGNFHARGFDGNDKMDHCAHIGLLRDVLKSHIKPRWKTPKGFAAKKDADKSAPKLAAKSDKPKVPAVDKPKKPAVDKAKKADKEKAPKSRGPVASR
jgi:hypothetical protein